MIGAVAAMLTLAGTVLDIALTMLPGWGPETVPASAAAWLAQLSAEPWLGLRNLDLLNALLALIGMPMYVALFGANRHGESALSLLALLVTGIGAAVFVSSNVALPMLELARTAAGASGASSLTFEAAARALLARGAHGSLGALPGFLISEIGTLLFAIALVRSRVLGRAAGTLALVGTSLLALYTVAITISPGESALVMAIAMPGGLLMMAWYVMVARGLLRLDDPAA